MPEQTPFPADDQPHDPWLADRLASGSDADVPDVLAELFAAAQAPATEAELSGEAALRAAFAEHGPSGTGTAAQIAHHEGTAMRSTRMSTKLAAAVAVGALSLVGVGAAALTGSVPGVNHGKSHALADDEPSQDTTDLPDDESTEPGTDESTDAADDESTDGTTDAAGDDATDEATDDTSGGTGPDATGPAAYGLCNAWTHGGLAETSTAYANLAEAAGGEESIETYCATIEHPGNGGAKDDAGSKGKKDDHPTKDDNPGADHGKKGDAGKSGAKGQGGKDKAQGAKDKHKGGKPAKG